jgi:hypothetical protein
VRFDVSVTVHGFVPGGVSQAVQLANVDPVFGAALSATVVPLGNGAAQGPGLKQLKPCEESVTAPEPFPKKVTVRAGAPAPPPLLVKHTTLAVMEPVTIAPDDEIPPELLFVFTVAEMIVPPHAAPVTVITPEESTVIICGVFELHVTWLVMSLVTGG